MASHYFPMRQSPEIVWFRKWLTIRWKTSFTFKIKIPTDSFVAVNITMSYGMGDCCWKNWETKLKRNDCTWSSAQCNLLDWNQSWKTHSCRSVCPMLLTTLVTCVLCCVEASSKLILHSRRSRQTTLFLQNRTQYFTITTAAFYSAAIKISATCSAITAILILWPVTYLSLGCIRFRGSLTQ